MTEQIYPPRGEMQALKNVLNSFLAATMTANEVYAHHGQQGLQQVTISGQGHFNLEKSEKYRRFPKLLELL